MVGAVVLEPLVESMLSDFDVLAAACRAEIEGTASPEVIAVLHSPALCWVRTHGLHYVQTLFEGEMHVCRLSGRDSRRREAASAYQRAETLRLAALSRWRAELADRHRNSGPRTFEEMCAWLMKLLLPEDYSREFGSAMIVADGCPDRGRLPSHDWYAWGVEHGWSTPRSTPETDRVMALGESAFVDTVRRSLTVEYIAGFDEPPVVERWWRALSRVELLIREDMRSIRGRLRRSARRAPEHQLTRLRELYEEFAVLRVHRSVALRVYNELRDAVATAVKQAEAGIVSDCHTVAAAAVARAHPEMYRQVREVVAAHRKVWEDEDFDFATASDFAQELITAVAPERAVAEDPLPLYEVPGYCTDDPLEVAVDASGYGSAGGYGWMAADGRTGSGRCTWGISSTESEVIAICEAASAPQLAGRTLHILSDCVAAVDAVDSALTTGVVGNYPVSEAVRDQLRTVLGRTEPFTVQWGASRTGHRLHDRAHCLARSGRLR
ncbi:hypothetical protein [Nocardia noduli]|uniref:hypothetical protein n=1 Tax=Nocardia noduli TaxID=2815722 RepID=UPI001C247DD9|nr:hypothetical protein [Nocardia noduli]